MKPKQRFSREPKKHSPKRGWCTLARERITKSSSFIDKCPAPSGCGGDSGDDGGVGEPEALHVERNVISVYRGKSKNCAAGAADKCYRSVVERKQ